MASNYPLVSKPSNGTSAASGYSVTGDPRIVGAVRRIEEAAYMDNAGQPWVETETQRKQGCVLVRVVCTFKFPLGAE